MTLVKRPQLVEFLAVVAVVGVLLALLLPATQSAREAARRAQRRASPDDAGAPAAAFESGPRGKSRGVTEGQSAVFPAGDQATITLAGFERKIVYEAQVTLIVDNLDALAVSVAARLQEFHGYISLSNIVGAQGEQRSGTWQVRVPVDQFDAFLRVLENAGVVENISQSAQDVSEEYVDLEARIANQEQLEQRIVKLLDATDDKISDIIQVEQQLARVRGEIERMQGRLRFLTNRVELTTVTINAREEHDYVPPAAPTFVNQMHAAWGDSLGALQQFAANLSLAAVAATPWIAALGLPLIGATLLIRRARRARSA